MEHYSDDVVVGALYIVKKDALVLIKHSLAVMYCLVEVVSL